jgi:hypothetical protein
MSVQRKTHEHLEGNEYTLGPSAPVSKVVFSFLGTWCVSESLVCNQISLSIFKPVLPKLQEEKDQ